MLDNAPTIAGYLGPIAASRRLGISDAWLWKLAKLGRIPSTRLPNGHRLFLIDDLDAYAQARAALAAATRGAGVETETMDLDPATITTLGGER